MFSATNLHHVFKPRLMQEVTSVRWFQLTCPCQVKKKRKIRISSRNFVNSSISGTPQFVARHLSDPYVKLRFVEGYRCRSAYKLKGIQEKHKILEPGMRVLDLGACPGSWSQVAAQHVFEVEGLNPDGSTKLSEKGLIIACDLQKFDDLQNVIQVTGDFTDPAIQQKIKNILKEGSHDDKADLVICDAATNSTGLKEQDHLSLINLIVKATMFVVQVLRPGGSYLFKVRSGQDMPELKRIVQTLFETIKVVKPPASRAESSETFLLCQKFLINKMAKK